MPLPSAKRQFFHTNSSTWRLISIFILLIFSLALVFRLFPDLVRSIYLNYIFQFFRITHDYSIGYLPIPTIYIILIIIVSLIIASTFSIIREGLSMLQKVYNGFLSLLCLAIILIGLFYLLWGFNYLIPNNQVAYKESPVQYSKDYLIEETTWVQNRLTTLRSNLSSREEAIPHSLFTDETENYIRIAQEELLDRWNWPTHGKVRIRILKPNGLLLRISTAGVYIPQALEGHIDGGMFHVQYPFTMAHEMAHGYGFTDEGFCNFVGFLTCICTSDPYIQYSGWLNYWRYLMNDLRTADRGCYEALRAELHTGIRKDLNEIYRYQDRYPDILPTIRDKIYDTYLKSHGVQSGLVSYSQMTKMVYLWKSQNAEDTMVINNFNHLINN